jgi:autotransporter-associated beta strand protein
VLNDGRVRLNATSGTTAIGSRVLLSGDIASSGVSTVTNVNGGGANPATNNFTHKGFDFTGAAHTIDVASGTLTFTSAGPTRPLEITATHPGGTTLTKVGAGVLLFEHAVETTFTGVNRVEQGVWRLGASERLANASQLEAAGGVFDVQGFSETVATVVVAGGSISGSAAGMLNATTGFQAHSGAADIALVGLAGLVKSTGGAVQLNGANSYAGATTIDNGTLLVGGTHVGGGNYTVNTGGTLGGTGVIGSTADAIDVAVTGGTLSPGTSVGTLTVEGAVSFDALSHFKVEVQGSTVDKLVANALTITSGAKLDVSSLGSVTAGARVIAEYDVGMLTGTFTLNAPAGYTVSYATPGQIILNVPSAGTPGDFNMDGTVDGDDLMLWQRNTSIGNLSDWRNNFGFGGAAPVPEPAAGGLLVIAMATLVGVRRRGSARS